jgi:hypothetical protein
MQVRCWPHVSECPLCKGPMTMHCSVRSAPRAAPQAHERALEGFPSAHACMGQLTHSAYFILLFPPVFHPFSPLWTVEQRQRSTIFTSNCLTRNHDPKHSKFPTEGEWPIPQTNEGVEPTIDIRIKSGKSTKTPYASSSWIGISRMSKWRQSWPSAMVSMSGESDSSALPVH